MRKLGRILFAEQRPQPVLSPEQRIPVVINRGVLAQDGMETWTINGKAYDGTRERLHAGVRYRLIFANKSDEGHPLHLHRHLFELTRVCGRAVAGVWKDVVALKRYAQLEVDFTPIGTGLLFFTAISRCTWLPASRNYLKSCRVQFPQNTQFAEQLL